MSDLARGVEWRAMSGSIPAIGAVGTHEQGSQSLN